jgi:hypothetical protein
MSSKKQTTDEAVTEAVAKQQALMEELGKAYSAKLDEDMGKLHNQFVTFISAAKLPLPQVALVLEILLREVVDQAMSKYMGD